MSKAAPKVTKSKVTKEIKSKTSTTEKQPATLFEIVPGKFYENDWNNMLEIDDSQEFIWDLIDEIIDNSDRVIYNNYLQNQIIPYALNETKNTILELIDWEFLSPDSDIDDDVFAEMDDEPEPTNVDSWALGYIETFLEEVEVPDITTDEDKPLTAEANNFLEELNRMVDAERAADVLAKINEIDSSGSGSGGDLSDRKKEKDGKQLQRQQSIKAPAAQTNDKYKPEPKARKSIVENLNKTTKSESSLEDFVENSSSTMAKLKQIQENMKARARASETENKRLEEAISKAPNACHSILKSLLSRPPGYRELEIDANGKVVSIMKIDIEKLPNNSIKPKFNVTENTHQETTNKKLFKKKTQPVFEEIKPQTDSSNKEYKDMSYYIEPASGVTFQMGKVSRIGPKKPSNLVRQQMLYQKTENLLKPIRRTDSEDRSLINRETIEKILDHQSESDNIKPLPKFHPIPPINPTHHSSQVN